MNDDDNEGWTEGRTVYITDDVSEVLGPDGEPLRYSRRAPVGFNLRASKKSKSAIERAAAEHAPALQRLAKR
jgi:hypothetical protein